MFGRYTKRGRPLLYQPARQADTPSQLARPVALRDEPLEAAQLYEAFFDQTIPDGAMTRSFEPSALPWPAAHAHATWQTVDDREIYLTHQQVAAAELGDWAEPELYEVCQNQTGQRQEIVYYFSLPESAVLTGVWLGASADGSQRTPHHVSPRGAAQAICRNESGRQVDPALLEQIGSRQYRLRIFPVEPQTRQWDESGSRYLLSINSAQNGRGSK